MDLTSPISSVIPSLDGPVLQVLASSSAPLSLTKVHQRAGRGSLSGVRKVLSRLVEHGLVDHDPAGYVLNRDHVAAPAIRHLAQLHGEVARRICGWLENRPEDVVAAGLYGSAARRDGDTDSDIDLIVVTGSSTGPALSEELAEAIERWTGNRGQVVLLTCDEVRVVREEDRPIVESWRRDLQMLIGDRAQVVG